MPNIKLTFDLNGNPIPDTSDKGMEIFERGNLVLVVSELEGELSIQCMGPPSEKVVDILHHVWKTYRKIVRRTQQNVTTEADSAIRESSILDNTQGETT